MRIGLLHSIVRKDEKLLIDALKEVPGLQLELIDDRTLCWQPNANPLELDGLLARSVSHTRNLNVTRLYESLGVPCFNKAAVAEVCGDKLQTSLALDKAGVPQPNWRTAFTPQSALQTIEEMGYPVVLKPVQGSWGRMISRINDRDAAEAILEHKATLGGP